METYSYTVPTILDLLNTKLTKLRKKEYSLDCKYKTLRDTGKKLNKELLGELYDDVYQVYAAHITGVEKELKTVLLDIKSTVYEIRSL